MISYNLEINNLPKEKALDNLLAVINSRYFQQYELRSDSQIQTNLFYFKAYSEDNSKINGGFEYLKLNEIAGILAGMIKDINTPKVNLQNVQLYLYYPNNLKSKIWKNDEDYLTVNLNMNTLIELQPIEEKNQKTSLYGFAASILGEYSSSFSDKETCLKGKRKYDQWGKEWTIELKKVLPHQ
jgi:hypothetical protein